MAPPTTLTQFEATLLPTGTPPFSRGAATQLAGCCADAREQLSRGTPWATVQDNVLVHRRHAPQMSRWGMVEIWRGLTGP